MKELQKATDELIRTMSDVLSTNEEINASLQPCFQLLQDSSKDDVDEFMKRLFALVDLPDTDRGSFAATICGYLVERGFPSDAILSDFIDFYEGLIDKASPFYNILFPSIEKLDKNDEEYDDKVNELYSDLINDKETVSNETYNAVNALDKFYACGISLFSINKENFYVAKRRLHDKVAYINNYSQGCYWFNTLFSVLFDEPVIVIDIDREIGFKGKISGIADNYQLQHMLMGLPILNNDGPAISEDDLQTVNGTGEQTTDRSIESKWNMYNLELCNNPDWRTSVKNQERPDMSAEIRQTWIWSEGTPQDITVHKGYRIILLGKPSVSRSSRIQRTFKNLKANIEIEMELTKEDINNWLNHNI